MKLKLTAFAVYLFTAIFLRAANYYVDYSAGNDSNAGTSTGAAWKHCPGDPAASGSASSTALGAGDTVFFKGGVTYVFTGSTGIILKWNGTSNSPITYDGNSAGTWGSGRALMTDNYSGNNISAFEASTARSYITIKNFDIGPIGGAASLPSDGGSALAAKDGHGVTFYAGVTGGIVDNCVFHALGYWFNQKPMGAGSIGGSGVYVQNANGLKITNCDFTKMSVGLCMYHTAALVNVEISNCRFHDYIRWGIDFAATSTSGSMDHVNVHDCSFYDYYQFDQTSWKGYGEWPHTDGIFHRNDYTGATWGGDINFYNNTFSDSSNLAGGTASIYITEGPSANIYNNTFIYQGKGRTIYFYNSSTPPAPQVVNIVNNTFLLDYTPGVDIESDSLSNTTITVKNNIFYDSHIGSGNNFCVYINTSNALSKVTFDYNIYKSFNFANGEFFNWASGIGEGGLALMQGHGWETHGQNVDPKLTVLGTVLTPLVSNLNLLSGSPAAKAGVNLTSMGFPGLSSDKNGKARPSSGAWDVGAYSLGGTGTTLPPSNALINVTTNP
jgi:hypothetical protein